MMSIKFFMAILAVASAWPFKQIFDQEFTNFKIEHNRAYSSPTEERFRYNLFMRSKLRVSLHNEKFARGEVPYKVGLTRFSDMTRQEASEMLGLQHMPEHEAAYLERETRRVAASVRAVEDDGLPDKVDWREKGAVTPVRDQGHCRASYAFSAAGALEGQMFLKTGVLPVLSTQQLVHCSQYRYCKGGLPALSYEYVERNGGLATEEQYPYHGPGGQCQKNITSQAAVSHGYRAFKKNDEWALKEAVAKYGPVTVGISVVPPRYGPDFYDYTGGVFYCPERGDINHSVLVVGYSTSEKGWDYWIVKNSWGEKWGENGYFKLKMDTENNENTCFIAAQSSIPIVWSNGK
ncbi:procathepsin L [Hyalella azteca]|uniref:Procathepsin L n=1 Tax=Hyalella azteca TaxID=294128 RepID=A0A979FTH8_HYAAZ|nr:procathepsin L [Hyalella azteca]